MDNKYENDFSLNVVLKAFKKQILTIIYFFICFTIIGVTYAMFINPISYESRGSIKTNHGGASISVINFTKVIEYIDKNLYAETFQTLKDEEIRHSDNTIISLEELKNGISLPEIPTSPVSFFEFKFTNKDKTIVKPVMEAVLKETLKESEIVLTDTKFVIREFATDAVSSSSTFIKIVPFAAGGLAIGLFVGSIIEWRHYTVSKKEELEEYGVNVFELKYRGGKKNEQK